MRRAVGAVAHQQQLGRNLRRARRTKMRSTSSTRFTERKLLVWMSSFSPFGRDGGAEVALFLLLEAVQVDEVGNDVDVLLDGEILVGFAPQVGRNRRHAVALVDAERDHRLEAGILAHQRDIGAVQRGDHRNLDAPGPQNLLGHKRRRGVRNGVVHVQHVELLVLHDVDHLAGQGQLVGRKLEERVRRHVHLVVEEVLVEEVEPHRLAVGDEVHAVAALGQGLAQLRGHHAGAAKRGITNDADIHREKRDNEPRVSLTGNAAGLLRQTARCRVELSQFVQKAIRYCFL